MCAFLLQFNILLCSYADNLIIFVFGNNVIYVLPIFSSHSLFNLNIFSFSLIILILSFLHCSSDLCFLFCSAVVISDCLQSEHVLLILFPPNLNLTFPSFV